MLGRKLRTSLKDSWTITTGDLTHLFIDPYQFHDHQELKWVDTIEQDPSTEKIVLQYIIGTAMTTALKKRGDGLYNHLGSEVKERHAQENAKAYKTQKKHIEQCMKKGFKSFAQARQLVDHEFFQMGGKPALELGMDLMQNIRTFY